MKFSQFAGTALVPTLSRLVLALAFTTVGFNKLTRMADFDASEATTLQRLGVSVSEKVTVASLASWQTTDGATPTGRVVRFASFQPAPEPQDAPEKPVDPPTITIDEDAPAEAESTIDQAAGAVTDAVGAAGEVAGEAVEAASEAIDGALDVVEGAGPDPDAPALPEGTYTAKSMYRISLFCDAAGWPQPYLMAWVAALTEFLGGLLLLVGFLSRIWGLGLAFAMGSAFYLTSMRLGGVGTDLVNPFEIARDIPLFNTVFNQLGLFVLAFGVFLTGAGPLSLDHLLFRRRNGGRDTYDDDGGIIFDEPSGS